MSGTGVASIGECMLELSGAGEETWRMGFAGDTFNTLWAIRALTEENQPTDYVSAFGDDPFSDRQIAFLREAAIGIASSPVIPGARPGLYAITLDGAERSFTYWRSDAAARRLADDPEALAASLRERGLIYFSGITLAILREDHRRTLLAAIAAARRDGAKIAFDPNYRPRLWGSVDAARQAVAEALAHCDIALPTFPDEQALYGDVTLEESAERIRKAGVAEIVVKNGSEPALSVWAGALDTIDAVHVANPVDTTGAGDSFNGAYLAARLAGDAPAQAVHRSHRVAAAVVQVPGALAPFAVLREAFDAPVTAA